MALDIPVPSASPFDDPDQYLPLILSAIEGFLLAPDVWTPETYDDARPLMQELLAYAVQCWGKCGDGTMIGEIKIWSKSNVPAGYLSCNGQAVSRAVYSDLFDVISTGYGLGDGSTTFNLPNLSDRSPMGQGATIGAIGSQGGAFTHTLSVAEMPSHDHRGRWAIAGATGAAAGTWGAATAYNDNFNQIENTGGGGAHNNLHPVLAVHFIIYAGEQGM